MNKEDIMILFNNAYATVWSVEDRGNFVKAEFLPAKRQRW